MALSDYGCTIGLNGDPHSGGIDGKEAAAVFAGEHTFGFDGFPAPAVEAKNPIGLRDRVPAFDIGEFTAIGLTVRICR